jgi:hypothetical protein
MSAGCLVQFIQEEKFPGDLSCGCDHLWPGPAATQGGQGSCSVDQARDIQSVSVGLELVLMDHGIIASISSWSGRCGVPDRFVRLRKFNRIIHYFSQGIWFGCWWILV